MKVERKRCKIGSFYLDYHEVDGQNSTYAPLLTWSFEDFKNNLEGKTVLSVRSKNDTIFITLPDMELAIVDGEGRGVLSCNHVTVLSQELETIIGEGNRA